eukprot:11198890-Lingulodinium_polyedra.AAC.1
MAARASLVPGCLCQRDPLFCSVLSAAKKVRLVAKQFRCFAQGGVTVPSARCILEFDREFSAIFGAIDALSQQRS